MTFDIATTWLPLVQILVGVFLIAQGVLVLIQNYRSPLNQSFLFFQLVVFVWMVGMGLAYLSTDEYLATSLTKIGFLGVLFIPIATYMFSVEYARKISQRKIVVAGIIATLVVAFLTADPRFTLGVFHYSWGFYIHLGPMSAVAPVLFAVFMSLFGLNFFLRYKEAERGKKWHLLALATGLLSYLGIVDFLPAYGVILPFHPPGFIFVGIFSTLMGYFILRYSLADIKVVVGRTAGYVFFTALLVLIYAVLFIIVSPAKQTFADVAPSVSIFIVAVLFYGTVGKAGQRLVDAVFFREQINFEKLAEKFTGVLRGLQETDTLLKTLFDFLDEDLRASDSAFLVLNQNEQTWTILKQQGDLSRSRHVPATVFTGELPVFSPNVIYDVKEPLFSFEPSQSVSSVMTVAAKERGELLIPLSGRTIGAGFLIIGSKKSGDSYGFMEKAALLKIASAFAVSWENAKLYESISKSNQIKLDFISVSSHQLRTPLTRFKWAFEMFQGILKTKLAKEEVSLFDELKNTIETLIARVNQLLDVAESEKSDDESDKTEVDFGLLIDSLLKEKKVLYREKNITCNFKPPPRPILAVVKEKYLKTVLDILIDNAMLYSKKDNGFVAIEISADSQHIKVSIKDNGIGIPEKEQDKIFSKFFRGSNASSMHPDGTGLGLHYGKLLIEKQGGTMWFASKEGEGTTFFFTLPKAKPHSNPPQVE